MSIAIALKVGRGGQWAQIGEVGSPRVVPSSVSLVSDDSGPLSASFMLAARSGETIPALLPFTPVRVEVDGLRIWSGFVRVPTANARVVSVDCNGTQAHLDGDTYQMVPADAQLSSWDNSLCTAESWTYSGTQEVGSQGIIIGWPNDGSPQILASSEFNGVTYMAGFHQAMAIRVVVEFASTVGARFVVVGHDCLFSPTVPIGAASRLIDIPDSASGVFTGFVSAYYRFISMGYISGPGTVPAGVQVTIPSVTVYDRLAYQSSLLGSDVADRVAGLIPQISADASRIVPSGFQVPHFTRTTADTGRGILAEAAAYDDSLVQVDAYDRLVFAPRSSSAVVEFGHNCPASGEAPQDPAAMASAVDVSGSDAGGNPVSYRFGVANDPEAVIRQIPNIPNPDFAVNVTGWTLGASTQLARSATNGPAGIPTWASIQGIGTPGNIWVPGEVISAAIPGTLLGGVAYRIDIYAFDQTAPTAGSAPAITLRLVDFNDPQALVERTLRLVGSASAFPWTLYSTSWVPRFDTTAAHIQIYDQPLSNVFSDGLVVGFANHPAITGVRIYTADTLLSAQRVQRVGAISMPTITGPDVASAVATGFLRGSGRLGYVGTRTCADGAAKDARTGAPLPAAALLGLAGQNARLADRLDPDTGAVGANVYISQVSYDAEARESTVTLGSRYNDAATLVADLSP